MVKTRWPADFAVTSYRVGSREYRLPFKRIDSGVAGPKIVITAGMDGDELEGIDACFRLSGLLSGQLLSGSVTLVPVANYPGYLAVTSCNPDDGLYPKRIYPGKAGGTPTEELVHRLVTDFVAGNDVWLDLHGGAATEALAPCVLTYETGVPAVDGLTKAVVGYIGSVRSLYSEKGSWQRATAIGRDKIAYLILESGWGLRQREADVARHVTWVMRALTGLGMFRKRGRFPEKPRLNVFRRLSELVCPADSHWQPVVKAGQEVVRGHLLGHYRPLISDRFREVKSPADGTVLWMRIRPQAVRGDCLCAVSSKQEFLWGN